MAELKLNFKQKPVTYSDYLSKSLYAKYHCGFPGARQVKTRFKTAESYADNLKKFLGDPNRG